MPKNPQVICTQYLGCPVKDGYPLAMDIKMMQLELGKLILYGKQWHHNANKNNICCQPRPNFSHHLSYTNWLLNICPEILCGQIVVWRTGSKEEEELHSWEQAPLWPEVIGVTFLTPALVPNKVTIAPALKLSWNLHSNSCLNSENLKAMSILLHEAK